jgi:hypothetical protein
VAPMHPSHPRRAGLVLAAAIVLASAVSGHAQGGDDRAVATATVQDLQHDPAHASIAAAPIASAKDALERATRMRGAGDEAHAKAAEGLAREWADMARDLVLAADAEKAAWDAQRKARDAQAQLERARALVEEGIARVGRMRSELDEASHATPERKAVEVHGSAPRPAVARKNATVKDKPVKSAGAEETP